MSKNPESLLTFNRTPRTQILYLFSTCSCWGTKPLSHSFNCIHNNLNYASTLEEITHRQQRRKLETCLDLVEHFYVILPGKCGNCHPKLDVFGWLIERNRAMSASCGVKMELVALPIENGEEKRGELRREWEGRIEEQKIRAVRGDEEGRKRRMAERKVEEGLVGICKTV
jgi:hypothetical protein